MATIKEVLESGAAWCVERGDALDVLGTVPDDVGGALIADPPAGIGFMGKGWDAARGGRESWIAWLTKILAQGTRTLRPGGRSLVWSLPRTSHWTGCAVDDAGLTIETSVLHLRNPGMPFRRGVRRD
jgi:site-specific DNA-methyltransferase (adenine-specific)